MFKNVMDFLFGTQIKESDIIVNFDQDNIQVVRPDDTSEKVRWDQLEAVIVEIGAGGAMVADMVWTLVGRDGTGCVFPGGATGENELLDAMRTKLSGFREDDLVDALAVTAAQELLLWTATPITIDKVEPYLFEVENSEE